MPQGRDAERQGRGMRARAGRKAELLKGDKKLPVLDDDQA